MRFALCKLWGMSSTNPTLETRFWSKVDKRGPRECWLWTGARKFDGYGRIWDGRGNALAPRIAWLLTTGEAVPSGLCVCHRCDNPPCVNPAHLFLATNADNVRDCHAKGRWTRGETHGNAKLSGAQVQAILSDSNTPAADLARELGVSPSAINDIKRGRSWAWLSRKEAA